MLPPPEGPGVRGRKPSSEEIFCCSFLRISSRSGGPSLFFLPHWGSFGGMRCRVVLGCRGQRVGSAASGVGERFAKPFDAGPGERTYLDIQYLTMGVAHHF